MNKIFQKGVSLYLVIIVMTIIFAIVFSLTTILLKQIKIARQIEDSSTAYYAAEAGIEEALKAIVKDKAVNLGDLYPNGNLSQPKAIGEAFYDVKIRCCVPGPGNCIFGVVGGGSCPGLSYSCPDGIPEDESCQSPSLCISSKGTYNGTERTLSLNYGLSQIIEYDYFSCTPRDGYTITKDIYNSYPKRAQFFTANQDYQSSSIEIPLSRSGLPGDVLISIQKIDNDLSLFGPFQGFFADFCNNCPECCYQPDGNKICEATLDGNSLSASNLFSLYDNSRSGVVIPWDNVCELEKGVSYAVVVEIADLELGPENRVHCLANMTGDSFPNCNIIEGPCRGVYAYAKVSGSNVYWEPYFLGEEFPNPAYDDDGDGILDCYDTDIQVYSLYFNLWRCPIN